MFDTRMLSDSFGGYAQNVVSLLSEFFFFTGTVSYRQCVSLSFVEHVTVEKIKRIWEVG